MIKKITVLILMLSFAAGSWAQGKKKNTMAAPHVLVYKTRKDYNDKVPVTLSADKAHIVSYPDPADINKSNMPVVLHNGYLLDKRGIGKYSAFLSIAYTEYSNLSQAPAPEELYGEIIDKNPLTELYDCGPKYAKGNAAADLNKLIDNNELAKKCKLIAGKKHR